ncbi:MAG: cation:proton antiporter [Rhizobacter sp.]|nr:cation:proton antiporter [Chlorobiales bacterium]
MPEPPPAHTDFSLVFIELGAAIIGLSLLTRLASRFGFSTVPLYLLAGLAFGNGGLLPLQFSADAIRLGAEVGVLLLLFMLGLEYTGEDLGNNLRTGLPAAGIDFIFNFSPGLALGLLLGWTPLAAVLLGGATWVSSSGVIAKVLGELSWMNNHETPVILSVLVLEDLAMAVFLPLISVLLIGQTFASGAISIAIALTAVGLVLFVAIRYGDAFSRVFAHQSNEVILFTALGLMLLVAGVMQRLQVSAAIGAFLVGIAISGPMAGQTHTQLGPLRDLFAAIFFLFFGLQIDPASLPPVLPLAIGLGIVTALTKMFSGWWAARHAGIDTAGSLRAGATLTPRGEFSIVITGLGVSAGLEPQLGPLAAAYVLFLAVLGPLLARAVEPLSARFLTRKPA